MRWIGAAKVVSFKIKSIKRTTPKAFEIELIWGGSVWIPKHWIHSKKKTKKNEITLSIKLAHWDKLEDKIYDYYESKATTKEKATEGGE